MKKNLKTILVLTLVLGLTTFFNFPKQALAANTTVNFTGFETGDNIEAVTSTNVTFDSTTKKSGGFSLRCNRTTSNTGNWITGNITTNGVLGTSINAADTYVKFQFLYHTKPATGSEMLFATMESGSQGKVFIRLDSAGKLSLYDRDGTTQIGSTGATVLSADTWYELSLHSGTGTSGVVELKINGVSEISTIANNINNTNRVLLGKWLNYNSQTVDFYYDDLVIDSSDWPVAGTKILKMGVTSNGSSWGWSGSYADVDELPNDGVTTQVSDGTTAAAYAYFQSAAVAGISGTIYAVKASTLDKKDATTVSVATRIKSGASTVTTTGRDVATAYAAATSLARIQTTDPATSAAWTTAGLDTIEVGVVNLSAPTGGNALAYCTSINLMVLFAPPPTYTIGGTISGLSGTVVLQNNSGDDLSRTTNGSFTFNTGVASGGAYSVTVLTQPAGQSCSVSDGSGTVSGNVTNVTVTCSNTSDIIAIRIPSTTAYSGWEAEIDISGMSTGGTYDFGLGTNNSPTNAKAVFTVTSQGYDDTGAATTITRTVYGTNYVRKIYPDNAQADETNNGGSSVTLRIALSDYIYSGDTITANIASSFYTNTAGNNATTSAIVTNSSVEAYPKVIANWSWPGYSRLTGSTFTLRATAFHRSAEQGRPVRAVKFTCTDQHANTVTNTVTSPTVDRAIGGAVPVVEYIGTLSTATLTQGDTLTCNFKAYPWYGDSNSVLDTSDGINTMPTPLYAPQYYLVDKDNTYGVTVAVVDSVAGNNNTGAAVDYASFDSQNPPAAFLNIYAAANAIAAYNNTNHGGRNNTGAGIIYLKEGSHVWTGGTVTAGGQATAPAWVTVTKFPGTTRANVLISSMSGTKQVGEYLKIEDAKITNSSAIGFTGMDAVWAHNCDIDPASSGTFYDNPVLYLTNSQFYNSLELSTYSTLNASRALVRGNSSATTFADGGIKAAYTVLGNHFAFDTGNPIYGDYAGQTTPAVSNAIYAFNILSQSNAGSPIIGHLNSSLANATGTAIIQNVLENLSGPTPALQVAADGSTADPVNNILIWNNTIIGQRLNMAYNDHNLNNIGPIYRKSWSVKNNIFDDYNCVTDTDSHGGTPNASRYGNHSVIHGVGFSSNVFLERTGAPGIYLNKFSGLNSVSGVSLNPYYVDDNSASGDGTGNGDYHLTASSPALNLISSGQNTIPYDIAGNLRYDNGYGAAGAYEWDTTAPTVTGFTIPDTASSLTVSISTFTATDNFAVTGYQITESLTAPASGDPNWETTATTTHTFTSAGSKTLYAWAKDAAGYVSAGASDSVTITLPTYTIGGTISGLTGTLVLQNNSGDNLSTTANGTFTFTTPLNNGVAYAVTVLTQPAGQTCTVTGGSGTVASASVTNVTVSCTNNDVTPPTITSVSSDKTNGTYTVGTVIDIDVNFSEAVTSTGNVTVTLETGDTDRTCNFTVLSAAIGTCNYTVQAGDTSSDLTISSVAATAITDAAGNEMTNFVPTTNLAALKAIVIDTTVPVRSSGSPSVSQAAGTTQVTLSLATNENATCKYSTTAGTAYGSIADTFSGNGSTAHSATVTGLVNGTSYNYYVRCQDGSGNANSDDYTISFSVASPLGGGGCSGCYTNPVGPGGGFKVDINQGVKTTSNRIVTLNFNAGSDVKKMAISMTGDFADAAQEDYQAVKQWDLCSRFGGLIKNQFCPDGTYTIYVRFFTATGRTSNTATASSRIALTTSETAGLKPTQDQPLASTSTSLFTKYLRYGQIDSEVKRLQIFLNENSDTRLAGSSFGSLGKETNFFGLATKLAVVRFQEKFAQDILAPWGLVKGTGFVGKTTLAKINEIISKIISR